MCKNCDPSPPNGADPAACCPERDCADSNTRAREHESQRPDQAPTGPETPQH